MSVYALSDLHGSYPLWRKVRDFLEPDDTLYFLGDAADRGKNGWQIIKELLNDERVEYIRGNHEQMLMDSFKKGKTDLLFYNGGVFTYYDMMDDLKKEKYIDRLGRTSLFIETYNSHNELILLSHSGYCLPEDSKLLWDREHIKEERILFNGYIIHGHTPCVNLEKYGASDLIMNETQTVGRYCGGRKICIDGASAFTNRCALLDIDTLQEVVFSIE